ncbi:MAG TPA: MMPL family transporter [Gaiellaceae bacterium]|nr:MMPL family transporter [Gaiellaceae bacterium]
MSAFTRAMAWSIVRLRWPIVIAWIAAAIAVVVYLPSLQEAGDDTSLTGLVPDDAESLATGQRLAELFTVPTVTHTHVVQRDPSGLPEAVVRRAAARADDVSSGRDPELEGIRFALPLVNAEGVVPSSRETGTTVITYLFFDPRETGIGDQEELSVLYAERHARAPADGLVGVTGAVPARVEEWREIEAGLPWVTLATLVMIALVLGIHFRSPITPLVTLGVAAVAYLVSLRTVAWAGEWLGVRIPRDAEPVLVVLLLGVVTDYAIFFLHGMRERLDAGEPRLQAAQESTSEYLPIVVTAGLIVAGGTASLMAGELDFFRAFGPGMALTVLVSLVVAITLVPALLAVLGQKVFWPRRPSGERPATRPSRLAFVTTARPVALVIAVVAVAALAVVGRSLLETELGLTQIQGLPEDSGPRRGQDAAAAGFSPGILSPTVVLVEGVDRERDLAALVRLGRALDGEPGVAGSIGPASELARELPGLVFAEEEPAARYLLVLDAEPQGGPAIEIVQQLRERLPTLLEEAGLADVEVRLAGDTALAEETVETITHDLIRIGIVAFLVNFLLLAIFLRALVAPLYLVLASALALVASIGLTTLVFQGFLGYDELTYHVPFAVAVLLLSLGSDYNVFVVGRIWQSADELPLREAIATAAPRASRAIGVAGLALALSFAALALIDLRQFREFAFAMSVGVLLDAFVIRALLIPALISLAGEASWWPRRRKLAPAPAAAD